jgi:hypothetical protein
LANAQGLVDSVRSELCQILAWGVPYLAGRLYFDRPCGLWLLTFGIYGIAGLVALQCIQLVPVARTFWSAHPNADPSTLDLQSTLAGAVLMSAIDNLLNGSMILPLLLVIGGLSAPSFAASADRVRSGARRPVEAAALQDAYEHCLATRR